MITSVHIEEIRVKETTCVNLPYCFTALNSLSLIVSYIHLCDCLNLILAFIPNFTVKVILYISGDKSAQLLKFDCLIY